MNIQRGQPALITMITLRAQSGYHFTVEMRSKRSCCTYLHDEYACLECILPGRGFEKRFCDSRNVVIDHRKGEYRG